MQANNAQQGIVRFNFAVSVIVIGILIIYLLGRLDAIHAQIEDDKVAAEVQTFRLQLAENWISNNIRQKNTDNQTIAHGNPMLLISDVPKHYIGEYEKTPKGVNSVWFYNTTLKHLVFITKNYSSKHFLLKKLNYRSLSSTYPSGGLDLATVETTHHP
jgi:hypothetical protein